MEKALLQALSQNEFVRARELWDQLPVDAEYRGRRHHYKTLIQCRLSASEYPGAFLEFMALVYDKSVDLETRVKSCLEAGWLAFRLNDSGRMARVEAAFRMLKRWYGSSAEFHRWRGSILLNFANLARQAGIPTALSLYQRAAMFLRVHEDLWCQTLEALCRLAVLQDRAEQSVAAMKALREATAISRGNRNHQEVHLATGLIALHHERWDEAIAAGEQAVAYASEQGDYHVLVESHALLMMAHAASGEHGTAAQYAARARGIAIKRRLYFLIHSLVPADSIRKYQEG